MLTAREGVERPAGRCRWGSVPRVPYSKLVPLGDGGDAPVGVLDGRVRPGQGVARRRPPWRTARPVVLRVPPVGGVCGMLSLLVRGCREQTPKQPKRRLKIEIVRAVIFTSCRPSEWEVNQRRLGIIGGDRDVKLRQGLRGGAVRSHTHTRRTHGSPARLVRRPQSALAVQRRWRILSAELVCTPPSGAIARVA